MKIAVGSDHAGYAIKEVVKEYLNKTLGYEVIDVGTNSEESVDYPTFGIAAAKKVANKEADFGIVICGSGIGIGIAANKVPGIRCALVTDEEMACLTRMHNDANMISLPGRFIESKKAKAIVKKFLETKFDGGRHQQRIDLIEKYEKEVCEGK